MNNKFPGFVEIAPEHARSIQFDVPLYIYWPMYIYWPNKWYLDTVSRSPRASAFTPAERRSANEKDGGWDSSYWSEEDGDDRRRAWYIKVDDDKPEYSPTTTTDTQHQ